MITNSVISSDLLTPGVIIAACSAIGAILVFLRSRKTDKVAQVDRANATVFEGYEGLAKGYQDYIKNLERRLTIAENRIKELLSIKEDNEVLKERLATAEDRIVLLLEKLEEVK